MINFMLCAEHYDLANPEEKYDVVPEIWSGHNIADFIDPEIMQRLDELEREEEMREKAGLYDESSSDDDETKKTRKLANKWVTSLLMRDFDEFLFQRYP